MSFLNYPRLSSSDASELIFELSNLDAPDRVHRGTAYRGRTSAYATATTLAGPDHLNELRAAVLELARTAGFPDADATADFDRGLPSLLGQLLQLSPAEAGCVEVWNYITLVQLPDVSLWRWPNDRNDPSYERLIGKPRNVFRRHWWRWYLLGDELPARMYEDELVAIVERPASLGGDPRVGRAVANAFLECVASQQVRIGEELRNIQRMVLMRDVAKRVLRIGRVVALSTLDDTDLRGLTAELTLEAAQAQALRREGVLEWVRHSEPTIQELPSRPDEPIAVDVGALLSQELERLLERAGHELGISTSPMRRMLADFGGVEAARLLVTNAHSEWFATVSGHGRLDLSVEAVVVREPFHALFADEEVALAQRHLVDEERVAAGSATVDDLRAALERLNARAERATGFKPPAMVWMLPELGPVETVNRLVGAPQASEGFHQLTRRGRLDLSLESFVTDARYAKFFDIRVRELARDRLAQAATQARGKDE